MGKAIPKGLKVKATFLIQSLPGVFTVDFEKNKRVLDELKIPFTKLNRNLVAGYIARKLVQKK